MQRPFSKFVCLLYAIVNTLYLSCQIIHIELFPPHRHPHPQPQSYPKPLWTSCSAISVRSRCWSYFLCAKLGLRLAASARFRTNYDSFWFSVSLQMQKCKMASRPLSQRPRTVWYGMVWVEMGWHGMSVCLLIDDRCGRRWSSFVYRLRRTCVSAFDPRTWPPHPWVRTSSCSSCIHRSGPMHLNLSGRQPNRSTTNQPQSSSVSHHASLRSLPMCTQKNYALINHLH